MKMEKNYQRMVIAILGCSIILSLMLNIALAEPSVSMKLKRNVGTDMGDGRRIEGDWTITGTGSAEVTRMELFFNGNKTAESANNSLSFRFNTRDYAIGETNITLIGYLANGEAVQTTEIREFLDPAATDRFLYITLTITGIIVVGSIVIAIIAKKKQNNQPKPTRNDVQIGEL
jgi:hypothetical protein